MSDDLTWKCPSCGMNFPAKQPCFRALCPARPDRYEEGHAAGIAEGRAQAFREAAEVARAEEAKWNPYDVTDQWEVGAASAAGNIVQAIEAKAKAKP